MHLFTKADRITRTTIAMVLMGVLLCAQWLGHWHRVAHGNGLSAFASAAQASIGMDAIPSVHAEAERHTSVGSDDHGSEDASKSDHRHSCSLFDAATLASIVHSTPFELPLITSVRVLALWTAFISWQAPVTCHFSSRAPPHL